MKNISSFAELSGRVMTEPVFSHESNGEQFYMTYVSSRRKSGCEDVIPVVFSETMQDDFVVGCYLIINGRFQSYNQHENRKFGSKLILYLFALECIEVDEKMVPEDDRNSVTFECFIVREPNYRVTPLGREISDVLVAVNREYHKSDYIPVLAWGRNAKRVSGYCVGTKLLVTGRMQSRLYVKKYDDGSSEELTTYEISSNIIKLAGEADSVGNLYKKES